MSLCPVVPLDLGVVRGVLSTVDCHVRTYSQAGFLALTGPQSVFPTALNLMLVIYVAFIGYRMMFGLGGQRLSDTPVMAVKIGFILAMTLGWTTFQTLVFDLAMKAPLEVARIVAAPAVTSGARLAADPLTGLQSTYDQLTSAAAAFGERAGPNPKTLRGGDASAAEGLWAARTALFMSTVGIIAIATIGVGVLATIGPIFIALFLFETTRGLFTGWVRALLTAAFTPMVSWIALTIMLVLIDPWMTALARSRDAGNPDVQVANVLTAILFIFAAAQFALTAAAGVIVGGFELALRRGGRSASVAGPTGAVASATARTDRSASASRPSAVSSRMILAGASSTASVAAQSAAVAQPGSRGAPAPALARLGDGYRREAFMDRFRKTDGAGS